MSETQVVSQLGGKLLGGGGTGIWQYDNFISKEECEELIKFFNDFNGINVSREQFNFLDANPNNYYPS